MIDELRELLTDGVRKPVSLLTKMSSNTKITVGQLREGCQSNPDHPISAVFLESVKNFPEDREVSVEKKDLLAVLDNQAVVHQVALEDSVKVVRKELQPLESENEYPRFDGDS